MSEATDRRRAVIVAATATIALWLLALLRFRSWRANDDLAITQLTIERFADGHLPLVGAYSRFGFFHPGPLREWTFGALYWLSGTRAAALPAAALVANAVMVALALVAAHRSFRTAGVIAAGTALALTQIGLGALLHSPWNPHLAVLAGAATGWGVVAVLSDGGRNWWLVVVPGSFLAQLHVSGVAPLAVGLVVVGVVLARAREWRRFAWAAATTTALWIGPLVDLGKGSDSNLVAFTNRSGGDAQGVVDAGRGLIRLASPWSLVTGDVSAERIPTPGPLAALATLLLLGAAAIVLAPDSRRSVLPLVALGGSLVAWLIASQFVTPVYGYLWAPMIGLLTLWVSTVVLAVADLIERRARLPMVRYSALGIGAATVAVSAIGWWSLTEIETASLQRAIEASVPGVVESGTAYDIRTGGNVLSLAHAEVALAVQQSGGRPTSNRFELALPPPEAGSPTLVTAMQEPLACLTAQLDPRDLVVRQPSSASGLDVGVFLVDGAALAVLDRCGIEP